MINGTQAKSAYTWRIEAVATLSERPILSDKSLIQRGLCYAYQLRGDVLRALLNSIHSEKMTRLVTVHLSLASEVLSK